MASFLSFSKSVICDPVKQALLEIGCPDLDRIGPNSIDTGLIEMVNVNDYNEKKDKGDVYRSGHEGFLTFETTEFGGISRSRSD